MTQARGGRPPGRVVLLHVGAPKTGTSFVQDLLFQNRERLAESGVLYPADRFDAHFLAALDLMEMTWGGLEQQAVGAWDRLAEQVRAWSGTVIVSHEILAAASRQHVQRALDSFGPDSEVHVVMSVRDLVRQVPAEWQENVKHRRTIGYRAFLDEITAPERTGKIASWFWAVQDIPEILGRWAAELPAHRVHVVTVPKPGAPRDLLWQRFADVFGLDAEAFDTSTVERANPSLGVAETVLVRRVNERVNNGVLANEHYREFVRELLAHRTLSWRPDTVRLRLPDDVRAWAVGLSLRWLQELDERGYHVVGDLEDLRPDEVDDRPFVDPDGDATGRLAPEVAAQFDDAALQSIEVLLRRAADFRREIADWQERLRVVEAERDQARREAGWWLRTRRAFIARADTDPRVALAYRAYRKVRRRDRL